MDDQDYINGFGKIVMNLQSFEFCLRLTLHELPGPYDITKRQEINFMDLKVCEWIPENYLTNYYSLPKLCNKLNNILKDRGLPDRIDDTLITLRDAVAHGRVLTNDPEKPYRILKFSSPNQECKVHVEFSEEITPEWFSQQITRIVNEVEKVKSIARKLGLNCFPDG